MKTEIIQPLFEVAVGLFSKMTPRTYVISPLCSKHDSRNWIARVGQTLLLFVITPINSGLPVPWVKPTLIAELERIWVQQNKPPELADRPLYDYFDVSFITASSGLSQPDTDISKLKAQFLDKDCADYAFQPRYQKNIAIGKLGLCMERLWACHPTICNIFFTYTRFSYN